MRDPHTYRGRALQPQPAAVASDLATVLGAVRHAPVHPPDQRVVVFSEDHALRSALREHGVLLRSRYSAELAQERRQFYTAEAKQAVAEARTALEAIETGLSSYHPVQHTVSHARHTNYNLLLRTANTCIRIEGNIMNTQLTRSMTNKKVAGVAGGIAEAFGWDVTLVRVGFVALTLLHGGGALLYLVLMLVMPKVGERSLDQRAVAGAQQATYTFGSQDRTRTLGYVLLGVGALMLAGMLHISGPVVAIAILGASFYLLKHR